MLDLVFVESKDHFVSRSDNSKVSDNLQRPLPQTGMRYLV